MIAPSWILLFMGILGAADIWFFHTRLHHLRTRPEARAELITHFLRGPTYAVLFLGVPNLEFRGIWFVVLLAVLLFDVGISLLDFWLEPESRAQAGGLPRGEYVLHTVLAMLFGALVATTLQEGMAGLAEPTSLVWRAHGVHSGVRVVLALMAPLVLWTGLLDLRAAIRLGRGAT